MISAARREDIVGALRRGTVPSSGLDALAVGIESFAPTLDEELAAVAAGRGGFKAVRGEYGTGKTFFGRWLQERARARGFAATEVQINETETPLHRLGHLLEKIPPARLFDEILKLFLGGSALQTFELLRHYRLFGFLFPATERCLNRQQQHYPKTLLMRALAETDTRLAEGKPVAPAFLFAALLWEPLAEQIRLLQVDGLDEYEALQTAADTVIEAQVRRTALPRRYSLPMREIWEMQQRLTFMTGKRPLRLLTHPRLRAGYDYLLLRAETDEPAAQLAEWWTRFMAMDEKNRLQTVLPPPKAKKGKTRRRRKSHTAGPPDAANPSSSET